MKSKAQTGNNDRFVIIMAGGRGERFWPVRVESSKGNQFLTGFLHSDRVFP